MFDVCFFGSQDAVAPSACGCRTGAGDHIIIGIGDIVTEPMNEQGLKLNRMFEKINSPHKLIIYNNIYLCIPLALVPASNFCWPLMECP